MIVAYCKLANRFLIYPESETKKFLDLSLFLVTFGEEKIFPYPAAIPTQSELVDDQYDMSILMA